jgi:hypothetical protein
VSCTLLTASWLVAIYPSLSLKAPATDKFSRDYRIYKESN